MSTKLLICDDSNMARKQLARSLPDGWDVDLSFATNGIDEFDTPLLPSPVLEAPAITTKATNSEKKLIMKKS